MLPFLLQAVHLYNTQSDKVSVITHIENLIKTVLKDHNNEESQLYLYSCMLTFTAKILPNPLAIASMFKMDCETFFAFYDDIDFLGMPQFSSEMQLCFLLDKLIEFNKIITVGDTKLEYLMRKLMKLSQLQSNIKSIEWTELTK